MWGPIIAAGIGAGGSLLGGMMSSSGQSATNAQQLSMFNQQMEFNRAEAEKNRSFQKEMSSTAYQRSMADMRAAGLNPILAAGGSGASTPGGASGSIGGGPSLGNPGEALGAGISSAAGQAARKLELDQVKSGTDLNKQTEENKKAEEKLTHELNTKAKQDTATSAAQQHGINATAANTQADTVNKGIQALILSHDATTAFQKSRLAKAEADQSERHGPGVWGNLFGTAEKEVGRTIDYFRSGEGFVDAQQRKERRLGDFVHQLPEGQGSGLTIDMRK